MYKRSVFVPLCNPKYLFFLLFSVYASLAYFPLDAKVLDAVSAADKGGITTTIKLAIKLTIKLTTLNYCSYS